MKGGEDKTQDNTSTVEPSDRGDDEEIPDVETRSTSEQDDDEKKSGLQEPAEVSSETKAAETKTSEESESAATITQAGGSGNVDETVARRQRLDLDLPVSEDSHVASGNRHRFLLAGCVAGVVVLVAGVVLFVSSRSGEQQAAGQPVISGTDKIPKLPTTNIQVGDNPTTPVTAGGFIWVTNTDDGTLSRIDPETGETTATIPVGSNPKRPVSAGGYVWVTNTDDGTVSRIDPETGEITATIDVGDRPGIPAGDDDALVVPNSGDGTLSFVDPEAAVVEGTVEVGPDPSTPEVAEGEAAVVTGDGQTTVVDVETRQIVLTFEAAQPPTDLLRTGDKIWTAHPDSVNVYDIETDTNEIIPTDIEPSQLVDVDGTIWAKGTTDVTRINSETLEVIDTKPFEAELNTITRIGETIWAALTYSPQILVLDLDSLEPVKTIVDCPDPTTATASDAAVYITCAGNNTVKQIPAPATQASSTNRPETPEPQRCDNEPTSKVTFAKVFRYDLNKDGTDEVFVPEDEWFSGFNSVVYTRPARETCDWEPVLTLRTHFTFSGPAGWCIDESKGTPELQIMDSSRGQDPSTYDVGKAILRFDGQLWEVIETEEAALESVEGVLDCETDDQPDETGTDAPTTTTDEGPTPNNEWILIWESREKSTYSRADVEQEATQFEDEGLTVEILDSDQYNASDSAGELNDGYWVIWSGPFPTRGDALAMCEQWQNISTRCYPRLVNPE